MAVSRNSGCANLRSQPVGFDSRYIPASAINSSADFCETSSRIILTSRGASKASLAEFVPHITTVTTTSLPIRILSPTFRVRTNMGNRPICGAISGTSKRRGGHPNICGSPSSSHLLGTNSPEGKSRISRGFVRNGTASTRWIGLSQSTTGMIASWPRDARGI